VGCANSIAFMQPRCTRESGLLVDPFGGLDGAAREPRAAGAVVAVAGRGQGLDAVDGRSSHCRAMQGRATKCFGGQTARLYGRAGPWVDDDVSLVEPRSSLRTPQAICAFRFGSTPALAMNVV
jgi:hypothetical protein